MNNKHAENNFLPIRDAEILTGIKQQTLRKLYDTALLKGYKTKFGNRMFERQSILEFCQTNSNAEKIVNTKANYLYTRVSSKKTI